MIKISLEFKVSEVTDEPASQVEQSLVLKSETMRLQLFDSVSRVSHEREKKKKASN